MRGRGGRRDVEDNEAGARKGLFMEFEEDGFEEEPALVTEGGRGRGAPKTDWEEDEADEDVDASRWAPNNPPPPPPSDGLAFTSPCSVAPDPGTPPNIAAPPAELGNLLPGVPLPPNAFGVSPPGPVALVNNALPGVNPPVELAELMLI